MYFGTYSHSLDENGRLTIPAKFREFMLEQEQQPRVFLACGAEPCIVACSHGRVADVLKSVRESGITGGEVRDFKRFFGGEGALETWDKQGRIILPEGLKAYAGIGKETTIVGTMDCFEIWDAETFSRRREGARSIYDKVAGKVIQ